MHTIQVLQRIQDVRNAVLQQAVSGTLQRDDLRVLRVRGVDSSEVSMLHVYAVL
jgi:hypothetical protein